MPRTLRCGCSRRGPPRWAVAAVRSLSLGHAGAGGGFRLTPTRRGIDLAIYHLRYGAFPPGRAATVQTAGDLAGGNAAYRRSALLHCEPVWRDAFWDVDVHAFLAGLPQYLVPATAWAAGEARSVFTGV